MDPHSIREDFPMLSQGLVYLDSAATSQKPRQVIEAVAEFYRTRNSNVHRGLYRAALEATEAYEEAHDTLARFVKARSREEIVFGRSTTALLNALALSLAENLGEGDEILVTVAEHHSNLLPWARAARAKKARLVVADVRRDGSVDVEDLESKVTEKTRIIAITHVSNVTGAETPIEEIARVARHHDALLVVDGAQAAPHMPLDLPSLGADFYVFSGHKMLGPSGIGVLWGRRSRLEELEPPEVGGGMVRSVSAGVGAEPGLSVSYQDLPWRLEAGTPNIEGAAGLAEAAKYLMRVGLDNVRSHEARLARRAEELLSGIKGVEVIGPVGKPRSIVPFVVRSGHSYYDPLAVAGFLSSKNIAVRAGFHCAQPLHERLGYSRGSVRASFYLYNTEEDVEALVSAVRSFAENR